MEWKKKSNWRNKDETYNKKTYTSKKLRIKKGRKLRIKKRKCYGYKFNNLKNTTQATSNELKNGQRIILYLI